MPNSEHEELGQSPVRDQRPADETKVVRAPAWITQHSTERAIPSTGDPTIDSMLRDCVRTLASKGVEYTVGSADRLHNFRTVGKFVGEPMAKVWLTYFYKHFSAVASYVKCGRVQSDEPIRGRVMDMIVYLLLFTRMLDELEDDAAVETRA